MPPKGTSDDPPALELCPDFTLRVAERLVTVDGNGISEFFNRAEDVEGCKVCGQSPHFGLAFLQQSPIQHTLCGTYKLVDCTTANCIS